MLSARLICIFDCDSKDLTTETKYPEISSVRQLQTETIGRPGLFGL